MTVILDDHLLRDWMARRDADLDAAVGAEAVATTNLWYARLCKSAVRAAEAGMLAGWEPVERRALASGLVALPEEITITMMRDLAWPMAVLIADHHGLSTLGAEAVAAATAIEGRLLVSARDDGPGIRRCCDSIGVRYGTLAR